MCAEAPQTVTHWKTNQKDGQAGHGMAKVTLKDIARETGMSVAAVSLVLNDRPNKISAEKRKLIRDVARKKGYVPNQIARSLVMQHSQTLGLIVPNIVSPFFSSLARELEIRCRACGYALFITNSDDRSENDLQLVRQLINRGVDGIFLVVASEPPAPELLRVLDTLPVPFLLVDRVIPSFDCDRIGFDNQQGGYLATRYLLSYGHRRVACIVNTESNTGVARLAGYTQALAEKGIELDPGLVLHSAYYISDAYEAARGLLATDATAVFASSDNIALGLLKRLYEESLRVPRDYSVVSYDNSAADSLFEPALTSIEQNVAELAQGAIEIMIGRLSEGDGAGAGSGAGSGETITRVLTPRLVVKASVRRR